MPRLLMVPLDGSTFAEQALPLALAIARRTRARLHLVRVRASLPLVPDDARSEAYLKRMVGLIEPELPGRVTHAVLTDEYGPLEYPPPAPDTAAGALCRYAEDNDAAVIVIATHGRGGLKRAWLGSVADALVRIATRPVLLIRPEDGAFGAAASADRGLGHIVIPLDGSEVAEEVIPHARVLGEAFAARYTLVRVVSPLTWDVSTGEFAGRAAEPLPPLSRAAAEQYLEQVAKRMRADGLVVNTHVIMSPSPASAIIDYATAHAADLVAMVTSGHGRVKRLLLGSVADKIVRGGTTAVLVCNAQRLAHSAEPAAETANATSAGTQQ
ncbi:MAG: universal stress protein [Gemmatimonadetes bacterium]|nr:universal stress protein [Gemmatimonadota bacterium]